MIAQEIRQMYEILVCILGPSKSSLDNSLQLQFSCPHCQERDGSQEKNKYHLEINIAKGVYNCWKCSSIDDSMHGSIYKLIRKYGNESLLRLYKDAVASFRESSLYKINFTKDEFQEDYEDIMINQMEFPNEYVKFVKGRDESTKQYQYLAKRGIDWPIIEDYHLGFTTYHEDNKNLSNRIILPSFDEFGDVNYWTARDFTGNKKRQRYFNPYVERKSIIFNEEKIQWNADITLVEGPFDHIVVPNSIPLLGKNLTEEYKIFQSLYNKSHANISIFLDGDAKETAKKLYKLLNQGRLKGRIRFIEVPVDERDLDPSKIFELWGRRGIIQFLRSAKEIEENSLIRW